jgi:hypothetical protein
VFFFIATHILVFSQEGIQFNTPEALNGYLLYENMESTYLVNNCGDIVHSWPGVANTELHAKLQEDGTLTYISNDEKTLIVRDWDNNVIYDYTVPESESDLRLVYEAILMPNGNFLCLARRNMSMQDFLDLGYDFDYLDMGFNNPRRIDGVVEINPTLDEIVWEWSFKDHVLQDRDQNAPNYAVASENPQLMNIEPLYNSFDWHNGESFMINGFDYNPELDQIALSVRKMGEVAIIDHSTTTEEARGSSGGNSGMGGDFIYRWGNPQNYGRGTADDRILYYQHNPNWIKYGPHAGKLICFNNGLDRPEVTNFNDQYSAVPIFDPIEDGFNYALQDGEAYGPAQPEVNFDRFDSNTFFFSGYTSAARVLPNGNIAITQGMDGRAFEINMDGERVWEYVADGYTGSSFLFRSERYSIDYPGLAGRDLTPTGNMVEFPPSTNDCQLFTSSVDDPDFQSSFRLSNNNDRLELITDLKDFNVAVVDMMGRRLITPSKENKLIDISSLRSGIYLLQIFTDSNQHLKTFKFSRI